MKPQNTVFYQVMLMSAWTWKLNFDFQTMNCYKDRWRVRNKIGINGCSSSRKRKDESGLVLLSWPIRWIWFDRCAVEFNRRFVNLSKSGQETLTHSRMSNKKNVHHSRKRSRGKRLVSSCGEGGAGEEGRAGEEGKESKRDNDWTLCPSFGETRSVKVIQNAFVWDSIALKMFTHSFWWCEVIMWTQMKPK